MPHDGLSFLVDINPSPIYTFLMNLEHRKILIQARGGSHAYGLSTPTSDVDVRGVFVNTDAAHLVGLKRDEVLVTQNESKDEVFTEFRHALKLLHSANTQMVELLFITEWAELSPEWAMVMHRRAKLVESTTLFKGLRGYMQGELRLANGERTGKLGGKRKDSIDKYGFSPKNFVQLFRLAWAGSIYFHRGYFPVNVKNEDPLLAGLLLDIKTHPEKFVRDQLNDMAAKYEAELVHSYENRLVNTSYDEEVATQLCLMVYGPLIKGL